ncbi:hypothetical protein VDG1235_1719 [Verrucomicrobiia bacterium DG1235]|nr:hypothetical protein VDG1235_1719 [Verrucomicrobiae bacterium DG1235]
MRQAPILRLLAIATSLFTTAIAISAKPTASFFEPSPDWKTASETSVQTGETSFAASDDAEGEIIYTNGTTGDNDGYLATLQNFSDQIVSFDYMVTPGSTAGVYLQGRYEVKLSDSHGQALSTSSAGALASGFNRNTDQTFPAATPLANAAKPAGEWNTIAIRFRTLRNDDAFNKLSNSLFLDITLNGETIQRDAQIEYYTEGSFKQWEQTDGPLVFRAKNGPIAIRNFQIDHADYEAVAVNEPGQPTNASELVDQVALGKETFTAMGCIECHTTKKGDTSFKTGPNLYGLFQRQARKREIVEPATGVHFSIDADQSYAKRSIRVPAAELAIAESGPTAGQPYLPVMAPYNEELLSNAKVDAIYRYLATLNDDPNRAAVQVLVPADGPTEYDPLADTMEVLVFNRTRIQRGSMPGVSGRSIHVGQPNGVNFTFDPRTLAIEKLWQGGFLNGAGEWENRGGSGFSRGFESKEINLANTSLLAPLNANGQPIDFSFKEAVFRDWPTIDASLNNPKDHLQLLAEIDAQFLGYTLDSTQPDAAPIFNYRIGQNHISTQTLIAADGSTQIILTGSLATSQTFSLNPSALAKPSVTAGSLANNRWTLPATEKLHATLSSKIGLASLVWRPEKTDTQYLVQPLVTEPTDAHLPAGYTSEQYLQPHDNVGRDLLFEATAIDVAPDGTIVVGTRTAGIWRLKDGQWRLFAEGLFDCLGLVVEDQSGLTIVAGQKPELTRISDTDGDGIADTYTTLSDQFSYHSNYHSYMHGPVRDGEGNYYYTLNLLHDDEAIYKGAGLYMGTSGGYSGWTIKVTPDGQFIPWASGLRSPASLGIDSAGRLWYADNQGEYVGTSKLFILEKDKYYGHPAGLVDLPGMSPTSPEIQWPASGAGKERAVALFPHNSVANSPGHMTWDETGGAFGPFEGQLFIGDQTQSKLLRVETYQINGKTRAAVFPFGEDLQSGIMRPVFLPDGSLLLGQTGRGWHAHGGKIASLQRISWDSHTVAPAIHTAKLDSTGQSISLTFTQALGPNVTKEQLQAALHLKSWYYRDAPDYGSPELDPIKHTIESVVIDVQRQTIVLNLQPETYATQAFQTARVYHLQIDTDKLFPQETPKRLETYITGE